jgi:hypothetical protein
MQPLYDEPESESEAESESEPAPSPTSSPSRRFITAMLVYAVLAVLAGIRLDGRPRLVVWIFLGLFAVKTLLVVLKSSSD